MENIPIVPGRGLMAPSAIKERQAYIHALGHDIENLSAYQLDPSAIRNNIESFVGSVEVPLGLVGPLLFRQGATEALAYCLVGTLEGALVASMNRGAKAISHAGGFQSIVVQQKMIRAPLFFFEHLGHAHQFAEWARKQVKKIKAIAEQYSNHAKLQDILPVITGNSVHLKFVYQTGDASGQNMTTTCTWHAILWVAEHFEKETSIPILKYVIEGNGASDKKASAFSMQHGRGIHVVAECILPEGVMNRILRTSSEAFLQCYGPSMAISKLDGMLGYNVNVANTIAGIFVATGQDLGCIHESALGVLSLEKVPDGLRVTLQLPALVVGTVGGGTHLPRQKEALQLMGCYGNGKVERFAQLIAGFALALEISTYAAIVSGEFAKAHEILGRNKPIRHLLKSEITRGFIQKCLAGRHQDMPLTDIAVQQNEMVENGIITTITGRVSRKLIGFIPIDLHFEGVDTTSPRKALLKLKALDIEVIKGLHAMAASIDPTLSDLFSAFMHQLEYAGCHRKEIALYEQISQSGLGCTPEFLGKWVDPQREIYLLMMELLDPNDLLHINSQKHPELWTGVQIRAVLDDITAVHHSLQDASVWASMPDIKRFEPWASTPLYVKLVSIMRQEEDSQGHAMQVEQMQTFVTDLEVDRASLKLPETIIHNDFNPRNIAIRKDGRPCIYDWELAVINLPHRDVVELLSFVLEEGFDKAVFMGYLRYHYQLWPGEVTWEDWKRGYVYAIKEYLVTRVSFYEVAGILAKYAFSGRILRNSFRMLEMLLEPTNEPDTAPNSQNNQG